MVVDMSGYYALCWMFLWIRKTQVTIAIQLIRVFNFNLRDSITK